jgi:hypothetical protein
VVGYPQLASPDGCVYSFLKLYTPRRLLEKLTPI